MKNIIYIKNFLNELSSLVAYIFKQIKSTSIALKLKWQGNPIRDVATKYIACKLNFDKASANYVNILLHNASYII